MKVDGPTHGSGKRLSLAMAGATGTFACALFTWAASALLLVVATIHPDLGIASIRGGLWLRALIFGIISAVALYGMVRVGSLARRNGSTEPVAAHDSLVSLMARPRFWVALAVAVIPPAILTFSHLNSYPWAAPDETHHLTVAKNLAEHGRYASGSPEAGFHDFDTFDSVGPPVIVPVAMVFKVAGVSLAGARVVMGLYLLGFLILVYIAFAHEDSLWAACCASLFAFMSFSTIYLGRTLYGEVPAMAWFLLGLLLWRRSWSADRRGWWALGAGLAFGMAILCKTIFLLTAFPLLGLVISKGLLSGRVRLAAIFLPPLGVALLVGGWWWVQTVFSNDVGASAAATLGLYQHYLLFGIEPMAKNLASFTAHPAMNLVAGYTLFVFAAVAFSRGASVVVPGLLLVSVFFFFWWIFYTPGQIPRYQWPGYVSLGMMSGMIFFYMVRVVITGGKAFPRSAAAVTACLVAFPYVLWATGQACEVLRNQEMMADHELADYVASLPLDWDVATTYYPLRGTLRFLAGREVSVLTVDENTDCHVLVERREGREPADVARFGPYAVKDMTNGAIMNGAEKR